MSAVGGGASPRELVEFVCPQEIAERPLITPFSATPIPGKPLVGDLGAGDGAALLTLPAGWRSDGPPSHPYELLVLEGVLEVDGEDLTRHGYTSAVPGADAPALAATESCLVFADASADVREAAVIPFSEDHWEPGNFPGRRRRILRGNTEGARGFLYRSPAGASQQMTEWHECAEAALMLEGDLWHVRANGGAGGTMRRHCYFWRPAYVLHSPMGTDGGSLMWIYVDGRLVNHFVEEEGGPPVVPS